MYYGMGPSFQCPTSRCQQPPCLSTSQLWHTVCLHMCVLCACVCICAFICNKETSSLITSTNVVVKLTCDLTWPLTSVPLQFAEKFAEYKEAARLAKEKSLDGKMELATSPSQVSICLSVCLYVFLSVYLSVCLSVFLPLCLSVC